MPVTEKLNIGSYIGVPIILSTGKFMELFAVIKPY